MTDLAAAEQEWQDWIRQACEAVGVEPGLVDVAGVHELTREIAHGFSRPMAPVGAFIWGLALGRATAGGQQVLSSGQEQAVADRLRAAVTATVVAAAATA